MHEAKVEAYIPLGSGPDAIEVIADSDGCQLNVMVDGVCEFCLNVNKFLELKLKQGVDVFYEARLEEMLD